MSNPKYPAEDPKRVAAHQKTQHTSLAGEHHHREASSSREQFDTSPGALTAPRAREYGTLIQPLSPIGLEGRTDEQVEADARKLEWIEENLLPSDLVRGAVIRFLGNLAKTSVHGALGSPELVEELLKEAAGSKSFEALPAHIKERLQARVEAHYSDFVEGSRQEPTAQEALEEEYEIARKELVRHWTSLVSSAVMLWGERSLIRFDQKLRPLPPVDAQAG